MGRPAFVTFTGADEDTDPSALIQLQQDFSENVEIGILVYPPKTGQPLYPRGTWIREFVKASLPGARIALHLCGEAIPMFLEQDPQCIDLALQFPAVQLNFFQAVHPVSSREVIKAANFFHQQRQALGYEKGTVIVPANKPNLPVIAELLDIQKVLPSTENNKQGRLPLAILFDTSGGKGNLPSNGWPNPYPEFPCGYAGGMNPRNISEVNDSVRDSVMGHGYWLDMQTGVRTFIGEEDEKGFFDISKCRAVMMELGF